MDDQDSVTNTPVQNIPETPVFETIPLEEEDLSKDLSKELAEETPEDLTPESITPTVGPNQSFDLPGDAGGAGRDIRKYIIIGGAAIFFIIVFIFILRGLLSLVGGGKKEPVTLTYWGLWEDEVVYKPLIEEYKRENPHITIKYSKQTPRNYREKLLARGREGRGPDIFRFHNTWLPTIIEIIDELPGSVMSKKEFEETFYEVAQRDLKIKDKYYGLPLMIDGLVMVYNEQLFTQAGLNTPPKTWTDVLSYANTLRVQDAGGNIITSGIAMGTANNIEHFSDILGVILLQNGATLQTITSSQASEALSFYRSFAEPPDSFWSENMPNNIAAFVQGKVAMIIVPSWQILAIKQANPELKIKVTHIPVLPGGELLSLANYWVEGVSKTSKHQLEAWKFLRFLVQKEQITKLYAQEVKSGRIFGEPYSRVDLKESLISDPYIGPVLEQAPYLVSMPVVMRTYDNGINDDIIAYFTDAIGQTMQGVSYEEALQTVAPGIKDVLTRYGLQ